MFSDIAREVREAMEFEAFMKREKEQAERRVKSKLRREGRKAKHAFDLYYEQVGPLFWIALLDRFGDDTKYPGYGRMAVPRDVEHWKFNYKTWVISNRKPIMFPSCRKTKQRFVVTHFGVMSWENKCLFEGRLSAPLDVWWSKRLGGVTPEFSHGDLTIKGESKDGEPIENL
jgi:hypothetical protein